MKPGDPQRGQIQVVRPATSSDSRPPCRFNGGARLNGTPAFWIRVSGRGPINAGWPAGLLHLRGRESTLPSLQHSSRTIPAESPIPADFPHICGVFVTLSHFFSVPGSVSKALSNLDTVEVTDSSSVGPTITTFNKPNTYENVCGFCFSTVGVLRSI